MKRVIKGQTYNTETAVDLCKLPCSIDSQDPYWHDTHLYMTKKGTFFLAGEGGPMSRWGKSSGPNKLSGGSGIEPIEPREAACIREEEQVLEWL